MNGKHEVRLERIERSLRDLHEKVDGLVEKGAVNRTEIVWLKWGLRLFSERWLALERPRWARFSESTPLRDYP